MSHRNPWLVLLWVIGGGLVAGAACAQLWLASFYFQPETYGMREPVLSFFLQLAGAMVAPAMLVGFATLAGAVFLHAWNHAHRIRWDVPQA